jgi:hypothetical protein
LPPTISKTLQGFNINSRAPSHTKHAEKIAKLSRNSLDTLDLPYYKIAKTPPCRTSPGKANFTTPLADFRKKPARIPLHSGK